MASGASIWLAVAPLATVLCVSSCNAIFGIEEGKPRAGEGGDQGMGAANEGGERPSSSGGRSGGGAGGTSGRGGGGGGGGARAEAGTGTEASGGTNADGGREATGGTPANEGGTGGVPGEDGGAGGDGGSVSQAGGGQGGTAGGGGTGGGASGSAGKGGSGCNPLGNDCGSGQYCDAADCASVGTCVTRPAQSSPTMAPACGCNGVTYWNLQHARWLGVTAFASAVDGCASGLVCTSNTQCTAAGSECVISHGLGQASCTNSQTGKCWALPTNANCTNPPPQPDVGFGSCANGPTTCTASALNFCNAVRDGNFFTICL